MTWVHVTSVLYGNGVAAVERLVQSTAHAARVAKDRGLADRVTYWIGDSSPSPVLAPEDVTALLTPREGTGLDEVRYDFYDANLGSAEGNNRLMRGLSPDFFLMVNPDIYASPRLIEHLMARFRDPQVGIAEARQLPFEHPKAYDETTGVTGWASMACCMLRGETVAKVGELDSGTFFLYCDDVDYSWRARLAGYRLIHALGAVAFHDKRLTSEGAIAAGPAEEYYAGEAALFLTYKYSREDLTERLLGQFEKGPPHHRKARAEFLRRREEGRLPVQLDPDHRVAEFVHGNYAPHRF